MGPTNKCIYKVQAEEEEEEWGEIDERTRGYIEKRGGGGVGYFPKAIISVSKIAWLGHWSMNEIYTPQ
jgi:hypothetical protein